VPWPDREEESSPTKVQKIEKGENSNVLAIATSLKKLASQPHLSDVDYKVLKGLVSKEGLL